MQVYNVTIDKGSTIWTMNNCLHREDGPAIECDDGTKIWYFNGVLHRTDGPAVVWADGCKFWWMNGKRHRDDGPAVEWINGTKYWWLHGEEVDEATFLKKSKKYSLIQTLKKCQLYKDVKEAHNDADQALLDYINDDEISKLYKSIGK